MFSRTFLLTVLCLCIAATPYSTDENALYVRYEVNTVITDTVTGKTDDATATHHLFLENGRLVYVVGETTYIVTGKCLVIIDGVNGTCLETPAPVRLTGILKDVSALRYLNTDRRECALSGGDETDVILGKACRTYHFGTVGSSRLGIDLWTTRDITFDSAEYRKLNGNLLDLLFYECSDDAIRELASIDGIPLRVETNRSSASIVTREVRTAVEVSRKPVLAEVVDYETGCSRIERTTIPLLNRRLLGPPEKQPTPDEQAVLDVIERFKTGCSERDIEHVDEWAAALFTDDVYVVGTDAPFPGTWEWRGGMEAAVQMFARDWKYWGDVKIFDDEMHLNVEGDAAYVVAFATVTREGDEAGADNSRARAVERIKGYAEEDWSSRRKLYEIIYDAALILSQYERGYDFVWLIRAQFDLVRRNGEWKIKVIHWSHPASGFRSRRLFDTNIDNR